MSESPTLIRPYTPRFSLLALLLATTVIAGIFALISSVRDAQRRLEVRYNFMQVGIALHNFSDTARRLPLATQYDNLKRPESRFSPIDPTRDRPLYSWRYSILPYLEKTSLPFPRDAAWDSEDSSECRAINHRLFSIEDGTRVCMLAITGPGTAFGDGTQSPHSVTQLPSDTILVVESRTPGHWMQPGDLDVETLGRATSVLAWGIHGRHPPGFHIVFADGEVWRLRSDIPPEKLAQFFTLEGAENSDRDQVLGDYRLE